MRCSFCNLLQIDEEDYLDLKVWKQVWRRRDGSEMKFFRDEYPLQCVGEASVDTQKHLHPVKWIKRQLPNGETCWDIEFTDFASSERAEDASTVSATEEISGARKHGKGVPPPKGLGKGKLKGKGEHPSTPWEPAGATATGNDEWTPALVPGAHVMTKDQPELTEDFVYARSGNDLHSYVEKERTVLGWDESPETWAVRMLCGSVWLISAHHLKLRRNVKSRWVDACAPSLDARSAAPAFPQAQSFELSKMLDSICQEIPGTESCRSSSNLSSNSSVGPLCQTPCSQVLLSDVLLGLLFWLCLTTFISSIQMGDVQVSAQCS